MSRLISFKLGMYLLVLGMGFFRHGRNLALDFCHICKIAGFSTCGHRSLSFHKWPWPLFFEIIVDPFDNWVLTGIDIPITTTTYIYNLLMKGKRFLPMTWITKEECCKLTSTSLRYQAGEATHPNSGEKNSHGKQQHIISLMICIWWVIYKVNFG